MVVLNVIFIATFPMLGCDDPPIFLETRIFERCSSNKARSHKTDVFSDGFYCTMFT